MNFFRDINRRIENPDWSFDERIFLLLTTISEIAVCAMCIGDIILGEHIAEIIVLIILMILNPIVVYLAIKYKKVEAGSVFLCCFLIMVIMPMVFFLGGGLYGGGVLWFSFCFVCVGIVIKGRNRFILLAVLTVTILVDFGIAYFYPDVIFEHSRETYFLDTLLSALGVGFIIYLLVTFQNSLYIKENEKAKRESEKVEQLNLMRNNFFFNMSHEIRTPINTILGLNEMILREDISDEVAEDAENIQAAGKLLLHLINDILDMSKLESGQMSLTPVEYKPADMLSEIMAILWIRAREKNLEFRMEISPDIPERLEADEVRIKQILINVITNAIKYTKEGSVTLSVSRGNQDEDSVNIIYSVSDTGMGIKKENIPYLFTAFKRVDEEKNRFIEGTGLGLSIVKQFVDLMGGSITVNSVYTRGSTFIIEIPQHVASDKKIGEIDLTRKQDNIERKAYKEKFEAPGAKVLIVDDNVTNLMVAQKLLRDTKMQIDTATNGNDALLKTLSQEYQVILMDHLMPEMDGIECSKKIRTQTGGLCRESKIVVLTANVGGENKELYEREGFDGYITKPVSGETLEKELLRLLPRNLITTFEDDGDILEDAVQWLRSERRKRAVSITTESIADIPDAAKRKYDISVIPLKVVTNEGVFRDGIEIDTRGLLGYIDRTGDYASINTIAPEVSEFEEFFGRELTIANNVIHISTAGRLKSSAYPAAVEAAASFDNVSVVESGFLSGGQGLMVMEACQMAQRGHSAREILISLEKLKERIHASFIVDSLDYLAKRGQVSVHLARITRSLMVRPVLSMKNGKISPVEIFFGSRETSWYNYIDSEIKKMGRNIPRVIYVNHSGLSKIDIDTIRQMIERHRRFERICFQLISPVMAANGGPGSFGILYLSDEDANG